MTTRIRLTNEPAYNYGVVTAIQSRFVSRTFGGPSNSNGEVVYNGNTTYYWGPQSFSASRYERIEDDQGLKRSKSPKPVSHIKCETLAGGGKQSPPEFVWSDPFTSYWYRQWIENDQWQGQWEAYTGQTGMEWIEWTGGTPSAVSSMDIVPTHIPTDPARLHGAFRSIIDDATKLYPKGDNLGLAAGELLELKTLFKSIKDILSPFKTYSNTNVLNVSRSISGAHLTTVWAIMPLVAQMAQLSSLSTRLNDRIATLQTRKNNRGRTKFGRSWTELNTIIIDGQTIQQSTVHTVGCSGYMPMGWDEEGLTAALVERIAGVTSIFTTLWALIPMSFAVDHVFDVWSVPGVADLATALDSRLETASLAAHGVVLPTTQQIMTADWCYSQKSTVRWVKQIRAITHPGPQTMGLASSGGKGTRYDRMPLDMSSYDPTSELGASPSVGLLAGMGSVAISMFIGKR